MPLFRNEVSGGLTKESWEIIMFYIHATKKSLLGTMYYLMSCYDCTGEWFTYRQLVDMVTKNPNFVIDGAYRNGKGRWVFPVRKR